MLQVILTPAARDDLDSLLAFVRAESPDGAAALTEQMLSEIGGLAEFPRRYPVARESEIWGLEVRSMLLFRYRVLYAVRGRRVVVLRIVHGAMLPPAAPDR